MQSAPTVFLYESLIYALFEIVGHKLRVTDGR
ncbi:Protein of unknown function [Pyronema omphalodes CBS 100304]|uniref:Uncharacterized protein n=1 Tax=Pyronema omphalodes (strain CBS 100304) TaxID=1076935 RepID=U4L497_PYROM|nr:Protein of unknown function [Pyronema omphalodes CBS 100304]